jgi:hypothetical protein
MVKEIIWLKLQLPNTITEIQYGELLKYNCYILKCIIYQQNCAYIHKIIFQYNRIITSTSFNVTPAIWRAVDWNLPIKVCIDMGDTCCIFHTYRVWFTFQVIACICINNLCCENILPNCIVGIVGRDILLVSVARQNFHFLFSSLEYFSHGVRSNIQMRSLVYV